MRFQQMSFTAFAVFFLSITGGMTMAQTAPTETDIRLSYHEQGARAQLHRWYQYYENPAVGLNNQLDVLSEDVRVQSANGTADSRDAYAVAVRQLPASWQNAHDLRTSDITVNDDGTLGLTAEITYTNIGILPDGAPRASSVSYAATLRQTDTALPVFTDIEITTGEQVATDGFVDFYVENRLLSLIHYWMALVEHPDREAEPFREILAPELDILFSQEGETITDFDRLAAWVAGPASSVSASKHHVHNFSYEDLGENRYVLTVDLDWNGIRPDDVQMTAKTRHTWTVSDTPSECFARIEKIRVEQLEPFAVVEN